MQVPQMIVPYLWKVCVVNKSYTEPKCSVPSFYFLCSQDVQCADVDFLKQNSLSHNAILTVI